MIATKDVKALVESLVVLDPPLPPAAEKWHVRELTVEM
jgi:hypothetical protein